MFKKVKKLFKESKFKKKLARTLAVLLAFNTISSVVANAAVGNSGTGISLITGGDGTPVTAPPITIDGEVAYCLNLWKGFPVATNYPTNNPYEDKGVLSILYHGYPVNKSGLQQKYGISEDHARYYTQVAIWQYLGEITDRTRNIGYFDELMANAKAGDTGKQNFILGSSSVEAKQVDGIQETPVITTSGSTGTFTFPSDNNVWSVDTSGNKKNVFNIGESFKVQGNAGFTGEKSVRISTNLKKPAALQYNPADSSKQNVVQFKWGDPLEGKDALKIKFNGAGKIVLTKTDDLGNILPGVKFGLFTDAAATNKVSEAVTGEDGKLIFDNVVARDYWIKELETVKSHVLSNEIKKVTVNGGDTQNVEFSNKIIKGKVKIIKVDSETGEKLKGAEFDLINKATGKTVEKLVTGEDGTATSGLHPYGDYIAKETKAPNKYVINPKEHEITINKDLQTIEVNHANTIIKGKVKIVKIDAETGEKLQGAEFELINKATGKAVEKLVTGEDGTATSGLHPYGDYIAKETKAPNKYVINPKNHEITINQNLQTIEIKHENKIVKGRIKVTKVDEETGEKLQGAEFEIKNKATGKVVEKLVTGEDGTAISSLHPYAEYIVKEIKAPAKYVLNGQEHLVTINQNLQTIELTHQNKKIKGRVEIIKEDSEIAGLKLAGAVFGIFDGETLLEEITTNEEGKATSQLINYGDYKMREIKAPEGYQLNDKEWDIQIREDQKTYTYKITNDIIKGKVQIVKLDSKNAEKPVEGAEFDIVAENVFGIENETVVETVKTDNNGFAFTKDLRYGDYYAIEKSVGDDYWLNTNKYPISIREHGKLIVEHIKNEPVEMKIRVIKTDGETKIPIKNVKFKIIDEATGEDVKFKEFFGIIPYNKVEFKTNKNGEIVFPQDLKYGNYSLVETESAEGYNLIEPIKFTINRDTKYEEIELLGKVHTLEVENTRIKGDMELLKLDADSKEPLAGVEFTIEALSGFNEGTTWNLVTNEEGKIKQTFNYGKYKATEIKTLEGYVLNSEPIYFEIKENGQKIELEMENKRIKGDIELLKIDEDTKKPLKDVEFKIESLNSFDSGKTWTFETNEEGKISLKDFNYGKYQAVEIKTKEEYILNDTPIPFEISEDGQLIELTATNKVKEGEVDFSKTDVTTGKAIDGANIIITGLDYNNDHIKLEFISSKENNRFKLPVGKYQFKETTTPEGFILNEEIGYFEIKENKVVKAELKNERIIGTLEFSKTDVTTGKAIDGAEIKIECIEGFNKGDIIEFVSSKEGNKFALEYGKYKFYETTAPEGYIKTTEIGEFEIKENGEIVKAELKNERITGTLEFSKTDVTTGKTIDGAHIKIECIEGFNKGEVIEFVSSKEGNKFNLEYGKYKFYETAAPQGYEKTTEVGEFEITESGQIIKAELKNERIKEDLPNTGDNTSVAVVGLALIASLTGIVILKKKKATN